MARSIHDPVREACGAIGNARLKGDAELERAARQQLVAAKLRRAVKEALAAFPPLTEDAKADIVRLLLVGGAADVN